MNNMVYLKDGLNGVEETTLTFEQSQIKGVYIGITWSKRKSRLTNALGFTCSDLNDLKRIRVVLDLAIQELEK